MSALPRGRCRACGADVALRKGDKVREHRSPITPAGRVCKGSGKVCGPLFPKTRGRR